MEDTPLADLFEPADRARWLGLVEGVLKGADFEKRLVSRTADGLRIEPLYGPAKPAVQPVREPGPWRIAQRVDHPDIAAANAQAITDLEGGADALVLAFAGAPAARGYGLTAATVEDLDAVLKGVMLPLIALRVDAGGRGLEIARLVKALAERRGEDLATYDLDLGIDPVGVLAATGSLGAVWSEIAPRLAETVAELGAAGFRGRAFLADGRPYHEAGAGEAAELGAVLATAVAYLRAQEAAGHDLDSARDRIAVLLAADADEFVTVAKFRAVRRLWARVEQACGLDPKPLRVHAETAWRMMTKRDPFVNILRTGMAAAAAGMGGADSVAVLPYTQALGLPDAFARRVGRNSQIVLIEESHLARVSDPAAGAGGFEALTAQIAEAGWAAFQTIEAEGGIVASLSVGKLQRRIELIQEARAKAVATRREALTGASEFPNLAEKPVTVLDVAPVSAPRGSNFGSGSAVACDALPSQRLAEPYETLRDASDAFLAKTGRRPAVFLANLGAVAAFNARATFAANAFAAGGIEALSNDGFTDADALAAAFRDSGAALACICSTDAIYAERAVATAEALARAGAGTVYLAGKPADLSEPLKQAGVDAFLHVGCDLLALLNAALRTAMRAPTQQPAT
ncbi:Methylmalonyl-CoA mutase small subunit [Methylobacterium tardum]|uniref:Methylmalonyl-CoA mutase n=1 Tax=Methylobacterium tardum TaxID=374432 RepID=A0AA37WTQ1_9HYPH|nr:methylmalonyl-CoA mutase subunit beta [Methylobacterium tardum]URD36974.1 methylmalonyl-CoA mutase subunit beta [Methylobacterium tardum]GJE47422.1 Methylmalonyl-CoA mutase small subunit [Methylobacterium tardum]GLS71202.1 methylmalonyl-CoA mutase [Methylobacterium tardum]